MSRGVVAAVLAALAAAAFAAPATASEIVDRNATNVRLQVNAKGEALVTYTARGQVRRVLVWGAINAIHPTQARPQVKFKMDYSGGWGKYRQHYWKTFKNACRAYDGPKLQWFVMGCKAPDGSYWAIQSWQRMLPNYGLDPKPAEAVWELRLSHWKGPIAQLEVGMTWAYRQYDRLYGKFTYLGKPVHGFRSTSTGVPLDTFGRNLYVDTLNSRYGSGWKRENSFLTHKGSGAFCYGFFPHGNRPTGMGERYRATIIGPGVTPDIYWEGEPPGAFDAAEHALRLQQVLALGSPLCGAN